MESSFTSLSAPYEKDISTHGNVWIDRCGAAASRCHFHVRWFVPFSPHGFFSLHYNYPSHELDNDSLKATLHRFEEVNWIRSEDDVDPHSQRSGTSVFITEAGGEIWESERRPDWSRYVMACDWGPKGPKGRERLSITGPSESICRDFFNAGCECGLLNYEGSRIRYASGKRRLFYWMPKQTVYLVSAWLNSTEIHDVDWQLLERRRTWWRSLDEIGSLWDLPQAS